MAAVAKFGFGYGFGSLVQRIAKFGGDLSVDGRDLFGIGHSISGLKSIGLPQGMMPKQRSGKCSFRVSVLTLD